MNFLKKGIVALTLATSIMVGSMPVGAKVWHQQTSTSDGALHLDVTCAIALDSSRSYFDTARLKIESAREVDKLGISCIDIETTTTDYRKNDVSKSNDKTVSFSTNFGSNQVRTITGYFYVEDDDYGNFSKYLTYYASSSNDEYF